MQFKLFSRASALTTLQRALDRDRPVQQIGTEADKVIGQPAAPSADKPLFKQPAQPNAIFRI